MNEKTGKGFGLMSFIFTGVFVLYYARLLDPKHTGFPFFFPRGELAADFFIVLAGVMLAKAVNSIPDDSPFDWREGSGYVKRVVGGFYPALVICWAVSFTVLNVIFFEDVLVLLGNLFSSALELTLLRNAGFIGYTVMDQLWVVSAVVIALFVLYPLYRRNKKRFEYFLAPAIAVVLLGYVFYKTESLVGDSVFLKYVLKSTLIAFGEVSLGVVCYTLGGRLRDKCNGGGRLLSAVELLGYTAAILYMQVSWRFPSYFDFLALIFIAVGVTVTSSGASSLSRLFGSKFSDSLGRFGVYVFLTFMTALKLVPALFPSFGQLKAEAAYLAVTFVSAVLLMLIEKPVKKAAKAFKGLLVKAE